MNEILVPVTDYPTAELAERLRELVNDNKGLLLQRHIIGPTERYGRNAQQAISNVETLKRNHDGDNPLAFAVLEEPEGDDVVGLATIYPYLPLGRMRLPILPGLPKHPRYGRLLGWSRDSYPYAQYNIKAWVHDYSDNTDLLRPSPADTLTAAYKTLVDKTYKRFGNRRLWTTEPLSSPNYIDDAIAASGLARIAVGRFEDNEDNRQVPPRSTLYAKVLYRWLSERGQLKELRTGEEGLYEKLERDNDDLGPNLGAYK